MNWDLTFSYSKVARRIFSLFILCALLPVIALSLISFRQVTQQLDEDSRQELRQAAKNEGMAVYERLRLLDSDMLRAAANPKALGGPSSASFGLSVSTRNLFQALAVQSEAGLQPIFGRIAVQPSLSAAQKQHLAEGNAILLPVPCGSGQVCVYMLRYVDARHAKRGILIGKVNFAEVLAAETLPSATILCITNENGEAVFCPQQDARLALPKSLGRVSSGNFQWHQARQEYVAGYWRLFLHATYQAPEWTFILSKSRNDILAPTKEFGRTFPAVILLTLLVVVLLTLVQIRRSMVPLQKLKQATQQIADRRFDTHVEITSGDEFQQLAEGFNQMTRDLGKQFRALETVREVDRAILSSLRSEDIIKTVLERVCSFLPYAATCITLLHEDGNDQAVTYTSISGEHREDGIVTATLGASELEELHRNPTALRLDAPAAWRSYLAPLLAGDMKWFLVISIRHEQRLLGVLALAHPSIPQESPDDRVYAIQLADRLAVALSNARLLEELADLNLGTLTALARAIDAKSEWTSGHSERVTRMAIDIAREMGLPPRELAILHRGGLLHDIGKIGTPAEILDKPGKLTEQEFRVMKEHVTTGARILEPIPGFSELIPIVLQHHERFDGTGYPQGLAGEKISLHARIFAVADVYDALISDRPYRPGWELERVQQFVKEQAGSHFDPRVVEAFLAVMSRRAAAKERASAVEGEQDKPNEVFARGERKNQCVS
ncbi:MAG TPA: HD domain-containing phosphohydrolase [Terriglobales bacterium]|nr:HD domain-containing phosphohydrolase [Terriglobales bacterium]